MEVITALFFFVLCIVILLCVVHGLADAISEVLR